MNPAEWAIAISVGLFVGMVVCLDLGCRIGLASARKNSGSAFEGIGAIEAAVFALLGLLLGFSFAGGTSRLDTRRQLIVEEANAIGTAYLRLDELPAVDQPEIRRLFREYIDTRLRVYERLDDQDATARELAHCAQLQQEIWTKAVTASRGDATQNSARLLLPALNEMIDITTTRTIALQTHLPPLIFALLLCVALLSALLAGYAMAQRKSRSWLHTFLYAAVVSLTVYAVVDLDNPRFGLIHVEVADTALHQLQESIR
jgi:hypothetical protein